MSSFCLCGSVGIYAHKEPHRQKDKCADRRTFSASGALMAPLRQQKRKGQHKVLANPRKSRGRHSLSPLLVVCFDGARGGARGKTSEAQSILEKAEGDTRCRPYSLFALMAPAAAQEERQAAAQSILVESVPAAAEEERQAKRSQSSLKAPRSVDCLAPSIGGALIHTMWMCCLHYISRACIDCRP